ADRRGCRVARRAWIICPSLCAAYCRSHFLGGCLRCSLQLPGLPIRVADRFALYSPLLWYWEIAVDRASVPHFNAAFADRANCSFWIRETGNCRGRPGRGVVGVRALPGFTR